MKKFTLLLLSALAMSLALLGFSACGGGHEHVFSGDPEVITPATCTQEGRGKRVCEKCGEEVEIVLEKLPHSYGNWYALKDATCSEEGSRRRDCIVCGTAYEEEPVEKTAHTPVSVEALPANCIGEGHEAGTRCLLCGETISGLEVIPALGHDLGEAVRTKESTCADHGIEKRTCGRCGHTEETELPLLNHVFGPIGERAEPTCLDSGITAGEHCTVCGMVTEERVVLEPLGHDYRYTARGEKPGEYRHTASCTRDGCEVTLEDACEFTVVRTPATCTAAEHHVHTCAFCENEYEHDEGIPLGHNFGEWQFDEEEFLKSGTRRHFRVCTNSGHMPDPAYPEEGECAHEAFESVEASCEGAGYKKYRCGVCENEYTGDKENALGHSWKTGENGKAVYTTEFYAGRWVHYKTCTRCEKKGTYYACYYTTAKWEKATCEKGARQVFTCADCGHVHEESRGEPLGHIYTNWAHDDETSGEGSVHYKTCTRCGDRAEEACRMRSADKVATCEAAGQKIDICEVCKYTERGEIYERLRHKVEGQPYGRTSGHKQHFRLCKTCGEPVFENCPYNTSTSELTCTQDAKTTYTCPDCGDSYTEIAEKAKGHKVDNYTDKDLKTHTGQCVYCGDEVTVPHDFSHSNLCLSCGTDGLSYAYVPGTDNTQAKVTGAKGGIATPALIIPDTVDIDGTGAVPVVAVGISAFFDNKDIREVTLPKSIAVIDHSAFQRCTNLERVRIAGHNFGEAGVDDCALVRIESHAFDGCTKLANAVLPATLLYIGPYAFYNCAALADISVPEQVTEIQDHAFYGTAYYNDPSLWHGGVLYIGAHLIAAKPELVTGDHAVQDGTVSISAEAFKDCKALVRITLPAQLKAVDKDAFLGCELETVVFKGTFAQYLAIRFDNDAASPMHFAKNLTIEGAKDDIHIPETATVIPAGAFKGSKIESVEIHENITSIGAQAFKDCASLSGIVIAEGSKLMSIGADILSGTAFYEDPANWSHGALYLRDGAGKAVALVAVDPARVDTPYTYEGEGTEYKEIVIEEGTRVVAPLVFAGFTQLRMITVPSSVIYLGGGMTEGCTALDRVNFRGQDGMAWFAYSATMGRMHSDDSVFGGGTDAASVQRQRDVARMFKLYTGEWKRNRY